jgi:hypothetical protein
MKYEGLLIAVSAAAIVASAAVRIDGQAPAKPAAKSAAPAAPRTTPRAPDGHPDLSGMYDLATLTPVERPAGTPLVLSDEQAAKLEKDVAARKSYQDAPVNADRGAPPVGGDGSAGAAGNVGGYKSIWIDSGSRYSVIEGQKRA